MVGTRARPNPWQLDDNRQQAIFIQQLRLLYQRSLRTRGQALRPMFGTGPMFDPQQQQQQHQDLLRGARDDLLLPGTAPRSWDSPAAAGPTATAAPAPQAAPGGSQGDAEDPCPMQSPPPPLEAGSDDETAINTTAAPPAAATANAFIPWQQRQQQTAAAEQGPEEEDSDDEPPPGMMGSSDEEFDEDEDLEEQGAAGPFYTTNMFARPAFATAADQQDIGDEDEDFDDPAADDDDEGDADSQDDAHAPAATAAIRRAWHRASGAAAAAAAAGSSSRQQRQRQQRVQQQQQLGFHSPLLPPEQWLPPAPCSFLRRGVVFDGCQRLMQFGMRRREEQWRVRVTIQDLDLSSGYIAGSMQAHNVPGVGPDHPGIETFWEGCVIDDLHHTFFTRAWGASRDTDLQHWAKFDGWADIRSAVLQHSGRCGQLAHHPVIYMRWKEQFFVNAGQQDCGLTIAGFYYVALHRSTGQIKGFYYDPHSTPFQELNMQVCGSSSLSSGSSFKQQAGGSSQGEAAVRDLQRRAGTPADVAAVSAVSTDQRSSNGAGRGVSFVSYNFA